MIIKMKGKIIFKIPGDNSMQCMEVSELFYIPCIFFLSGGGGSFRGFWGMYWSQKCTTKNNVVGIKL